MKVTATNTKEKTVPFVPFTMTLEVQTIQELMELYHRMNNNQLSSGYKEYISNGDYSLLGIVVFENEPFAFEHRAASQIFDVLAQKVKEYPQLNPK